MLYNLVEYTMNKDTHLLSGRTFVIGWFCSLNFLCHGECEQWKWRSLQKSSFLLLIKRTCSSPILLVKGYLNSVFQIFTMHSEMIWEILEFPNFEYYPAGWAILEYGAASWIILKIWEFQNFPNHFRIHFTIPSFRELWQRKLTMFLGKITWSRFL